MQKPLKWWHHPVPQSPAAGPSSKSPDGDQIWLTCLHHWSPGSQCVPHPLQQRWGARGHEQAHQKGSQLAGAVQAHEHAVTGMLM